MVHHDCRLGDERRQSVDGWGNWGFAFLPNAADGPVVSLTYETEAEARAAHALDADRFSSYTYDYDPYE